MGAWLTVRGEIHNSAIRHVAYRQQDGVAVVVERTKYKENPLIGVLA
jgi:hypothetical protein